MTTYYYLRFSETIVYRKRSLQANVLVAVKSLKFMVNKVQHRVAPHNSPPPTSTNTYS